MAWGYSRNEMWTLTMKVQTIIDAKYKGVRTRNDGSNFIVKSRAGKEVTVTPEEILTGPEGKRPFALRDDALSIIEGKFKVKS